MLFVEAPQSPEEVAAIAAALPGTPLLYNGAEGGRSPVMELDRLRELGFALVLLPIGTLLAATRAVQEELARVRAHVRPAAEGALAFDAFTDLIGLREIQALEQRYAG